ncbi:Methyltransferase domain-containing protein [Arboricoccus pini]|uniref:Methyltransferase domain-containing protein n=1 Tax=Arboricoccus pini TaxID=1963835 RepID=A0A212RWL9_9PROT|nr:class I SAM-dependent methyltransferase [Arboricoccus pini]SNB77157.1 Methyltransferase domain-containing protein [Arboricoccus pini]
MRSTDPAEYEIDRINRRTYGDSRVVKEYGSVTGWLDPGERACFDYARAVGAHGPLLDIGVGGGRTVPMMRAFSSAYVGIDYTPALLRRAQENHPGVDLREMDARRLDFADGTFGLVSFSYNGIDSVGDTGRSQILREVHRVLEPGGLFCFSSLNHEGRSDRRLLRLPSSAEVLQPNLLLRWVRETLVSLRNMQQSRSLVRETEKTSLRPIAAHFCGLIGRYTSLSEQIGELEQHGFVVEACFDNVTGSPALGRVELEDVDCLHYVARKTA